MKLWVTRPKEDAQATAEQLLAAGHEVLVEPLLTLEPLPLPPLELAGLDGIIITSRNAARRLIDLTNARDLPVYVVGDATGRLLWKAGFQKILAANGNLQSLGKLLRSKLPPKEAADEGRLLHLCGRHRAGDPATALAGTGYSLERLEAYDSQPVETLSETVRTSIDESGLNGVLLFSPRTARSLVQVLKKSDTNIDCRKMVAFCLSDKIAEAVRFLPWQQVITANAPKQSCMLNAIEQFGKQTTKSA